MRVADAAIPIVGFLFFFVVVIEEYFTVSALPVKVFLSGSF